MGIFSSLFTATCFLATILMLKLSGEVESTAVKAYCFKVYNRYQNGCTGLSIKKSDDIDGIKDTCCLDNNSSGHSSTGYAHLSQPLGFPGYFLCDRCPDASPNNKTSDSHHHHSEHHVVRKYKHQNLKKSQWKLKASKSALLPTHSSAFLVSKKDWKSGKINEWYLNQEKKKFGLKKENKLSNSVISEFESDASQQQTTRATATHEVTTTRTPTTQTIIRDDTTKSKLWMTDEGMASTKSYRHHYHHHHRPKHHHHHHHHHHHRYHQRKTSEVTTAFSLAPTTAKKEDDGNDDESMWSSWSDWTPCVNTGKDCVQRRTRFCLIASCPKTSGVDYEEKLCPDLIETGCSQVKNKMLRRSEKHVTMITHIPASSPTSHKGSSSLIKTSTKSLLTSSTMKLDNADHKRKASKSLKMSSELKGTSPNVKNTKPGKNKSSPVLLSPLLKGEKSKNQRQYEWSAWQPCSASCGEGIQVRKRICLIEHHHRSPSSHLTTKGNCSTDTVEKKSCKLKNCPVDGNWSAWKVASNCTSTPCSGEAGVITWSRACTDPPPMHGGRPCQGRDWKREVCYNNSGCLGKVNGGWCPWRNWVKSSKGSVRLRTCECPPPVNGGEHCQGPSEQTLNNAATTTAKQRTGTTDSSNVCDEELGSGDGSNVSCDQETTEKKSQRSLVRPANRRTFEDEDYEDDDIIDDDDDDDDDDEDDDDDDDDGSGDLK